MREKSTKTNIGFHNAEAMLSILAKMAAVSPQKQLAKRLEITPQYLCDVLKKRRGISSQLALKLGYQKLEIFIRAKDVSTTPTNGGE